MSKYKPAKGLDAALADVEIIGNKLDTASKARRAAERQYTAALRQERALSDEYRKALHNLHVIRTVSSPESSQSKDNSGDNT